MNNNDDHKSPWNSFYEQMDKECPENDTERKIMEMLGQGKSIPDCLEFWTQQGLSEESFLDFLKKADKWETENLRKINGK